MLLAFVVSVIDFRLFAWEGVQDGVPWDIKYGTARKRIRYGPWEKAGCGMVTRVDCLDEG